MFRRATDGHDPSVTRIPPAREATMARLMTCAQDGDRASYRELLGLVVAHVRESPPPAGHAAYGEDIVQESLRAVHAARHTWHPARPFGPWLNALVSRRLAVHRGAAFARWRPAGAVERSGRRA
ncbi:MAG: hypothetical protein Q8L86_04980 [Vicinamibacterales bacterium]|nr:hypothetical protein [Vicinamibacterales bacterium]